MKKIIFIFTILMMVTITSCYNSEDFSQLQKDCRELELQKSSAQQTLDIKSKQINEYNRQLNDLRQEMSILKSGKEPKYLIKIKIKQGTFTLDPFEHIKNEANAIEMEIPVDHDFYNKVKKGDDLTDHFKAGSFWIDGDLSWLHIVIINKRIK